MPDGTGGPSGNGNQAAGQESDRKPPRDLRAYLSAQDCRISVLHEALDTFQVAHRFNVTALRPSDVHAIVFEAMTMAPKIDFADA